MSESSDRPESWVPEPISPYEPSADPAPSRRPRGLRVGVAVLAVAALGAVGLVATQSGSADAAGAGSPEAAVSALLDALDNEDVSGVLDTLVPAERESLAPAVQDLVGQLTQMGFTSEDLDLTSVSGVDITIEGAETDEEPLGDGVTAVHLVAGTITTSTSIEDFPLGSTLDSLLAGGELSSDDAEPSTEDLATGDTPLVAVEGDDGWYVSLWYTVLDSARRSDGAAVPTYGASTITPAGASSPEEAVAAFVERVTAADLAGMVALLPPDEMAALYDYAPVLWDEEEFMGMGTDLTVTDLTTAVVDGDGGAEATVTIESITLAGTIDGEAGQLTLADGCLKISSVGSEPFDSCADPSTSLGSVAESLSLVTVEVDGRWYVSPTRSLFSSSLRWIEEGDAESLLGGSLFGETPFGEMPFGEMPIDEMLIGEMPIGEMPTSLPDDALDS